MAKSVQKMIDELVEKGQEALREFMELNQEQVDNIVKAMALAGQAEHMRLAKMAVEETGRGVYEDKMTKNIFATEYIYHSIKAEKTVGVISENDYEDYEMIAEPVGVVCGVTPVTNPTSTAMFNSIISIKARNPIIFGFHPNAQKCSVEAAKVLLKAAVEAGAPKNCIQWIDERRSRNGKGGVQRRKARARRGSGKRTLLYRKDRERKARGDRPHSLKDV